MVDHHIGIALRRYNTRLLCPVWHLQNSCFRQSSWRYWRESTLARRPRLTHLWLWVYFWHLVCFISSLPSSYLYNYRRAYFWHLVRSVLSFCRALSCIIIDAYISDTLSTWSTRSLLGLLPCFCFTCAYISDTFRMLCQYLVFVSVSPVDSLLTSWFCAFSFVGLRLLLLRCYL